MDRHQSQEVTQSTHVLKVHCIDNFWKLLEEISHGYVTGMN